MVEGGGPILVAMLDAEAQQRDRTYLEPVSRAVARHRPLPRPLPLEARSALQLLRDLAHLRR